MHSNRPRADSQQTDVWLAAVDGSGARRLTNSDFANEYPRWSADGKLLGFLSERPRRAERASDAEGKRQLWTIVPDGGDPVAQPDPFGGARRAE